MTTTPTTTINDDYKKLLFYANSLIAGVLNSKTIFNKNCQIHQIKNEFNKRVLLLQRKYSLSSSIASSIQPSCSSNELLSSSASPIIQNPFSSSISSSSSNNNNNIMLIISPKQ